MKQLDLLRRRTVRMASVAVALFSLLHACSSELEPSGGSETNWVSSCEDDGDCTVGACVCGVCSKSCTANTACPGGTGPTVCAMGESPSYRAVCGETSATPGVCLHDCSTAGCDAGFRCEGGACVPAAVSVPEGGGPLATIEARKAFADGLSIVDGGTLTGRCAGLARSDLHESECVIVEFSSQGSPCDCEARGLGVPSAGVLSTAREVSRFFGWCGAVGQVPCESRCGCQAPRLAGADLDACRNDDQANLSAGYCFVSPGRGEGSSTVAEKCPVHPDAATVLRYFGGDPEIPSVVACSLAHTNEVAVSKVGGAVGDPCTPSDQSRTDFSGFEASAIVIDRGTPECASNVCLVNNFQGRTDCPYGQPEPPEPAPKTCTASGSGDPVTALVRPQLLERPPETAVYCSCRCDGPGPGPFCQCPVDFTCTTLLTDPTPDQVAGAYCVKAGTQVENPLNLGMGIECRAPPAPRDQLGCGDP